MGARWMGPLGQALYSLWISTIFPHGTCQIPIQDLLLIVREMQLGRELGTAWRLLWIREFLDVNDVLVHRRKASRFAEMARQLRPCVVPLLSP